MYCESYRLNILSLMVSTFGKLFFYFGVNLILKCFVLLIDCHLNFIRYIIYKNNINVAKIVCVCFLSLVILTLYLPLDASTHTTHMVV